MKSELSIKPSLVNISLRTITRINWENQCNSILIEYEIRVWVRDGQQIYNEAEPFPLYIKI